MRNRCISPSGHTISFRHKPRQQTCPLSVTIQPEQAVALGRILPDATRLAVIEKLSKSFAALRPQVSTADIEAALPTDFPRKGVRQDQIDWLRARITNSVEDE
jgi:hypothetical protein